MQLGYWGLDDRKIRYRRNPPLQILSLVQLVKDNFTVIDVRRYDGRHVCDKFLYAYQERSTGACLVIQ